LLQLLLLPPFLLLLLLPHLQQLSQLLLHLLPAFVPSRCGQRYRSLLFGPLLLLFGPLLLNLLQLLLTHLLLLLLLLQSHLLVQRIERLQSLNLES
jgi:hypothetical protein